MSVLLERARNVEEDLIDQQKMTKETAESLSGVLAHSEKQESDLNGVVEAAKAMLHQLEEQLEKQQKALEQTKVVESAQLEEESAPHFSDQIVVPVPGRLRSPRPYLRKNESDG